MLKEWLLLYLSFAFTAAGFRKVERRTCDINLTDICRDSGTEIMNVDFLQEDILNDLKVLYRSNGNRSMLKGKEFDQLDSVFTFVAAFVNGSMGEEHRYQMTHIRTKFSKLLHLLHHKKMHHVLALQYLNTILQCAQNIKELLKDTFNTDGETSLYLLKFHLLDHVVEDLDHFRCLGLVSSVAYKQFNFHIKRA